MGLLKIIYNFMHRTIEKEWLELGDDVASLARDVLSFQEFEEAEKLTNDIIFKGERKSQAIKNLQGRIGVRPKRPIYYINGLLPNLPGSTRDIMRYLGDYIDRLVKWIAKENHRGSIYASLGSNLRSLKGVIPLDFQKQLVRYDKNIYVPAKHDFDNHGRKHRFTPREVVFTIMVTVEFGEKLKAIFPSVRQYVER